MRALKESTAISLLQRLVSDPRRARNNKIFHLLLANDEEIKTSQVMIMLLISIIQAIF